MLILLLMLILSACSGSDVLPDEDYQYPDDVSAVYENESLPAQETSPPPEMQVVGDESDESLDELIAELMETSSLSIKQGRGDYLFFRLGDWSPDGYTLFARMIRTRHSRYDGMFLDFDGALEIPNIDSLFRRAVTNDGAVLNLSYDFWRLTATLSLEKHTYYLDFESGTYTHEISYRLQDLWLDYPIAISPDGRLHLHTTYLDGESSALWGDYVMLDTETQEIWYVGRYDLRDHVIFVGADRILIARYGSLDLVGAFTGQPLPNVPQFEFGQSEQWEGSPQYAISGIAHDHEQRKTLIAYRENYFEHPTNGWERTHKVYVAVFDAYGNLINTIDTGFMMQPFTWPVSNIVVFDFTESGTAVLSSYVSYPVFDEIILGSINY